MKKNSIKYLKKIILFLILIIIIYLIFILYRKQINTILTKLIKSTKKNFYLVTLIIILVQILQVTIPFFPEGIISLTGVFIFGGIKGYIINYLGLILGSIIVFKLSRKYGLNLIYKLFKKQVINKYIRKINSTRFDKFLLIAIILPFFPDDLLCYISGLTNITFKKYILIVMIGRSISLIGYSLLINIL